MKTDGKLISELGVKLYLKGKSDLQFSNIGFFDTQANLEKKWDDCDFGCHHPSYAHGNFKRSSSKAEILSALTPSLAGLLDGMHAKTYGTADNLARGVKRTGEGLGVAGYNTLLTVGSENNAVIDVLLSSYEKIVNTDFSSLDSPLVQAVTAIVYGYILTIPESVFNEMIDQNALDFSDGINTSNVLKAIAIGAITNVTPAQINEASSGINGAVQKNIAKQIGKKIPAAIAAIVATKITKKILIDGNHSQSIRRKLVNLRKQGRSAKGGLAGVLKALLTAQGFLDKAGQASRSLQQDCPTLWNTLRVKLNGADMIYFLFQPMVQEYVDRISLLEKNPAQFANIMQALIKEKLTKDILYPHGIVNK